MNILIRAEAIEKEYNEPMPPRNNKLLDSLKEGDYIFLHQGRFPVKFIRRRQGDWSNICERYDVIDYYEISNEPFENGELKLQTTYTWNVKGRANKKYLQDFKNELKKALDFFFNEK